MIKYDEIENAQDAILGRMMQELENGYTNAVHDSYQSRTVLQFAQAIECLGRIKNSLPIEEQLPWVDVK